MDFVDFNLAKKLKEKGFDCQYPIAMYNEIGVFHALYTSADCNPHIKSMFGNREYYDYEDFDEHDYVAPTISQVLKWLRNEKNIVFGISPMQEMDCDYLGWCATIYKVDDNGYGLSWQEELYYDTYELAALAGIEYALDNLI